MSAERVLLSPPHEKTLKQNIKVDGGIWIAARCSMLQINDE